MLLEGIDGLLMVFGRIFPDVVGQQQGTIGVSGCEIGIVEVEMNGGPLEVEDQVVGEAGQGFCEPLSLREQVFVGVCLHSPTHPINDIVLYVCCTVKSGLWIGGLHVRVSGSKLWVKI